MRQTLLVSPGSGVSSVRLALRNVAITSYAGPLCAGIFVIASTSIASADPERRIAQGDSAIPQNASPETPSPPASSPEPPASSPPLATPPPAASPSPGTAPEKIGPKWYDAIALGAFVDGYASINYNFPKPQSTTGAGGGNQLRAFDPTQGFALHWVGLDASYAPDPVGGTVSFRAGPGARIYAGTDSQIGLENVKQAFASWRPGGAKGTVTLDFGKWDQPYGSEVAETQNDINYTRSALYWYAQPLFFTGLRVDWAPTDMLDFKLFVANGWNNSISTNRGKTAGVQVNVKPTADILISAGYTGGPQQADIHDDGTLRSNDAGATGRLKHLADVVVDASVTKQLRLLLNANYGAETVIAGGAEKTVTFYGANLAVRYAFIDELYAAIRGEYYADPDGATLGTGPGSKLLDGTVTFAYLPTPNLIFKLDQRLDALENDAGGALFQKGFAETSKTQMTTTLGIVVKTN